MSVGTLVRQRGNLYFSRAGNFVGYDNLRTESNILIITNWDKVKDNYRVKDWEVNSAIAKPESQTLSAYIELSYKSHQSLLKQIVHDLTSEHVDLLEEKGSDGPALAGENGGKIYITY